MRAPVLAAGDGALGFWAAVREVFPRPRSCAAGSAPQPTCSTRCQSPSGRSKAGDRRDPRRRGRRVLRSAESRWRAVNAPHLVALVCPGALFHAGVLAESAGEQATEAAEQAEVAAWTPCATTPRLRSAQAVPRSGRRRHCSRACHQAAWRRRDAAPVEPLVKSPTRSKRARAARLACWASSAALTAASLPAGSDLAGRRDPDDNCCDGPIALTEPRVPERFSAKTSVARTGRR
jgi:hypothetical protein